VRIPISKGWLPDFIPFDMPEGGCIRCENLLPYDEYYSPAKSLETLSTDAVTGVVRSGIEVKPSDSAYKWNFIGTSESLWRLDVDKGMTDVTRTASAYATGENQWKWVLYGAWLIATDYIDVPQVLKNVPSGTNFVALGGSPPRAKYAILYNGHLILAYTNESNVAYPKRIWRSAFESLEDYTPSLSTGAGYDDLQDADGDMTGIARVGSSIAVFFENSTSFLWYTGAPYTFQYAINKFPNVGAIQNTMISVGSKCFFWSKHRFHVITESEEAIIGQGVSNTVLSNLNTAYLYRITTHHDIRRGLIMWAYPDSGSAGAPNNILVYNYRTNVFTLIPVSVECIFGTTTGAILLDTMTYTSLADVPYYMDSNVWLADTPTVGAVSSAGYIKTFTGTPSSGVIETGEIKDNTQNRQMMIDNVYPAILNPSTASVRIGHRETYGDGVIYSEAASMQPSGRCLVRNVGRMLRIEMTTGQCQGIASYIDADIQYVGER
jgi:hypothetical protein